MKLIKKSIAYFGVSFFLVLNIQVFGQKTEAEVTAVLAGNKLKSWKGQLVDKSDSFRDNMKISFYKSGKVERSDYSEFDDKWIKKTGDWSISKVTPEETVITMFGTSYSLDIRTLQNKKYQLTLTNLSQLTQSKAVSVEIIKIH